MHYPELSTKDHERYLATIAEYGEREKIPSFKASMGMSFSKEDIENVREYAVLSKKAFVMTPFQVWTLQQTAIKN